jgi:hypothetical protein
VVTAITARRWAGHRRSRRRGGRRHDAHPGRGGALQPARDVLRARARSDGVGGDACAAPGQLRMADACGRVHRGRIPDLHARGVGGLARTRRAYLCTRQPWWRRVWHLAVSGTLSLVLSLELDHRRLACAGIRPSLCRQHADEQPVGDGLRLQRTRQVRRHDRRHTAYRSFTPRSRGTRRPCGC